METCEERETERESNAKTQNAVYAGRLHQLQGPPSCEVQMQSSRRPSCLLNGRNGIPLKSTGKTTEHCWQHFYKIPPFVHILDNMMHSDAERPVCLHTPHKTGFKV
jgi:hypothetical protein